MAASNCFLHAEPAAARASLPPAAALHPCTARSSCGCSSSRRSRRLGRLGHRRRPRRLAAVCRLDFMGAMLREGGRALRARRVRPRRPACRGMCEQQADIRHGADEAAGPARRALDHVADLAACYAIRNGVDKCGNRGRDRNAFLLPTSDIASHWRTISRYAPEKRSTGPARQQYIVWFGNSQYIAQNLSVR